MNSVDETVFEAMIYVKWQAFLIIHFFSPGLYYFNVHCHRIWWIPFLRSRSQFAEFCSFDTVFRSPYRYCSLYTSLLLRINKRSVAEYNHTERESIAAFIQIVEYSYSSLLFSSVCPYFP